MITRDYTLRQIHQLVNALSLVVLRRKSEEWDEARSIVAETLQAITGVELLRLRTATRDELMAFFSQHDSSRTELMLGVADLLREDGFICRSAGDPVAAQHSWTRAQWLYDEAFSSGGVLPYDIQDRMNDLADLLSPEE